MIEEFFCECCNAYTTGREVESSIIVDGKHLCHECGGYVVGIIDRFGILLDYSYEGQEEVVEE